MRARVSVTILTTLVAACFFAACSSSSSRTSGSPDSGTSTDDGGGGSTDGASTNDAAPAGDGGDQQLPGNLTTPTSCTTVCAAAGLTCDPNYNWQQDLNGVTGGIAAGQLEYHDSTDGYEFDGIDCTTVPAKTKDPSGTADELETLTEFDCACK
jgi:hypothetical protein